MVLNQTTMLARIGGDNQTRHFTLNIIKNFIIFSVCQDTHRPKKMTWIKLQMARLLHTITSKPCRIQYTCSLYVDKFEKIAGVNFVKPVAPILVLNGNIGKPTSIQTHHFLTHCSRIWSHILYIPGYYEMCDKGLTYTINYMKDKYYYIENVHILHNEAKYFAEYDSLFLGTMNDRKWLGDMFANFKNLPQTKIVALTYEIPNVTMIHPVDKTKRFVSRKRDLFPSVNAWVCGYSRGAYSFMYSNSVLCAYNARGSIDGVNDFEQKLGWCRSKYMDIPDTIVDYPGEQGCLI